MASLDHAVIFAVLLPALLVAHNVADHWLQTDHQAANKGLPGWPGRIACARHVVSYTILTTTTTGLLWYAFRIPINPVNFTLGQLISALSHYWADRRFTLARLCAALGKSNFYKLGSPRPECDDNPSLGTGAYVLDQSWHWGWLGIAAFITAV
jgi:hypothetical protein